MTTQGIVDSAIAAEEGFGSTAITPGTGATIRALKNLRPKQLAVMHGSCYSGDCEQQLEALAGYFDSRLKTMASQLV